MRKPQAQTLAKWMAEHIDSHVIYDPVELFSTLDGARFIATWNPEYATARVAFGGVTIDLPVQTVGAVHEYINNDPRGGNLGSKWPTDELACSGYAVSSAIDRAVTGTDAGSQYGGRGFAFRANLDHINEWAEQQHDKDCDCTPCLIEDAKGDLGAGHEVAEQTIDGHGEWIVCTTHGFTLMDGAGGVQHDERIADLATPAK